MPAKHEEDSFLIEYIAMGGSVKVTALDPRTLLEVSVIVPTNLPQEEAADLAIRKLRYLQKKNKTSP